MALLTRDQIIAVDDRTYEEVDVPEWGGSVRMRSLSGKERDDFEASMMQRKGNKVKDNMANFRARLLALCIVDENGKRLFVLPTEVLALGDRSAAAIQRLYNKANEMNGFSEKDVEDLTEDFDQAPDGASTSD